MSGARPALRADSDVVGELGRQPPHFWPKAMPRSRRRRAGSRRRPESERSERQGAAATRNERSERRARPIGRAGSFSDRSLSISISNSIALLNWNIPTGISICSLTLYLLHMFFYSIRNIFYSIRNIFYSIRNNYSRGNIPYGIIIPGGIFFYSIRNNYSRGNIFYSIRNIIPRGIFHTEYFLFHTEYYSKGNIFLFHTE